jgi:hypothetical protein
MGEHFIQCKKSILPLLKYLKPPVDVSCIHSAISLLLLAQSPNPLAVEAELQVLAELLPTSYPGSFHYAPRWRKDPGPGWSRVSQILGDNKIFT